MGRLVTAAILLVCCGASVCQGKTASAWKAEGLACDSNEDLECAVDSFQKAVDVEQGDAEGWGYLGVALMRMHASEGNIDGLRSSKAAFEKSLALAQDADVSANYAELMGFVEEGGLDLTEEKKPAGKSKGAAKKDPKPKAEEKPKPKAPPAAAKRPTPAKPQPDDELAQVAPDDDDDGDEADEEAELARKQRELEEAKAKREEEKRKKKQEKKRKKEEKAKAEKAAAEKKAQEEKEAQAKKAKKEAEEKKRKEEEAAKKAAAEAKAKKEAEEKAAEAKRIAEKEAREKKAAEEKAAKEKKEAEERRQAEKKREEEAAAKKREAEEKEAAEKAAKAEAKKARRLAKKQKKEEEERKKREAEEAAAAEKKAANSDPDDDEDEDAELAAQLAALEKQKEEIARRKKEKKEKARKEKAAKKEKEAAEAKAKAKREEEAKAAKAKEEEEAKAAKKKQQAAEEAKRKEAEEQKKKDEEVSRKKAAEEKEAADKNEERRKRREARKAKKAAKAEAKRLEKEAAKKAAELEAKRAEEEGSSRSKKPKELPKRAKTIRRRKGDEGPPTQVEMNLDYESQDYIGAVAGCTEEFVTLTLSDDELGDSKYSADSLARMATALRVCGVCRVTNPVLEESYLSKLQERQESEFEDFLSRIKKDKKQTNSTRSSLRSPGRFEVKMGLQGDTPASDAELHSNPLISPLIEGQIGSRYEVDTLSAITSLPNTPAQHWHQDTAILFPGIHTPAHGLVAFIPLIDLTDEAMGPPQALMGSHITCVGSDYFMADVEGRQMKVCPHWAISNPITLTGEAGSLTLFDLRTLHRGGANSHQELRRPVMYISYFREWYTDRVNFQDKQTREFDDLEPKLQKRLSRIDTQDYMELLESKYSDLGGDPAALQSKYKVKKHALGQ